MDLKQAKARPRNDATPVQSRAREGTPANGAGRTTPLVCSCGCTFAQMREDGALIIVSRHHGQKCINIVTLDVLEEARNPKPNT